MAIDFGIDDALEEISERVRERECILFLGSAVHARPPEGSDFAPRIVGMSCAASSGIVLP